MAHATQAVPGRHMPWQMLAVFLALSAGIILGGILFYRGQEAGTRMEQTRTLEAVAGLKVGQIVNWRAERLADARSLAQQPLLVETLAAWLTHPQSAETDRLLATLRAAEGDRAYYNVLLLDTTGKILLVTQPDRMAGVCDETQRLFNEALRTGEVIFSDFYQCQPGGLIHLDLVAPLRRPQGAQLETIGAVILQILPRDFLYPLIQSWPAPSRTAETLLIRREGDEVVYLNELRHRANTALTFRLPISDPKLPAAMAALGKEGTLEGHDYRGIQVLATVRQVPDSPWALVAKIDTEEVFGGLRGLASLFVLGVIVLIGLAGAVIGLIFTAQGQNLYQRLYQAESAQQAVAKRYETLVRHANADILLMNERGQIREANDHALVTYGYTRDEFLQLSLNDLLASETQPASADPLSQATTQGGAVSEVVHRRCDGSVFPVEIGFSMIRHDGQRYYQAVARDITQRRQVEDALRESEHKFRSLYESMTEMVALHDVIFDAAGQPVDYRITDVNPAYTRVTGLSRTQAVGALASQLYGTGTPPYLDIFTRAALTGETVQFETTFAPMEKDFAISLFALDRGRFATVTTDITERKRAEVERERLLAEVGRKNQELESIVYVASHDLRSPLVNIQGFSQRLQKSYGELNRLLSLDDVPDSLRQAAAPLLQERIPTALRFILASAAKMDVLINGLLRLSRAGRVALNPERLDMNGMIEAILATLAFQIEKSNTVVEVAPLPPCWGDDAQLNQVFSNLLDNALKYRDPDRPLQIRVTGRLEGDGALYCVEDTAQGIATEHQPKIWEVFHRLNPQDAVQGEGLGLPLARRIVERHHGRMWVESVPGQGSRFFVALPTKP